MNHDHKLNIPHIDEALALAVRGTAPQRMAMAHIQAICDYAARTFTAGQFPEWALTELTSIYSRLAHEYAAALQGAAEIAKDCKTVQ